MDTPAKYRKYLENQAKKAPPCPKCQSTKIVPVGYGVQAFIASKETDLVVCHGGHIVGGVSPIWACKECRHEFGVVDPEEFPPGSQMFVD